MTSKKRQPLPKFLPFNVLPYSFNTLEDAKGFQQDVMQLYGWDSARAEMPGEQPVYLVAVYVPVQKRKKLTKCKPSKK